MEGYPLTRMPRSPSPFSIGNRPVGPGAPCFIIAEAGVNHNGDIRMAKQLVAAAADAGADAIKFQTFKAEDLVTAGAEKAEYQKKDGTGSTQLSMLRSLELPDDAFRELAVYARKKKILFLSTAFDDASLSLLAGLAVPAFKIPSGEITNLPLIGRIARLGKPVILSTGMSDLAEVGEAIACLRKNGCEEIVLLHCTTCYPAPLESVNLRILDTFRETFGLPVGYSDHTEGVLVSVAAVARGACLIEKHITLDRMLKGPDHAASIEPAELKRMVAAIRDVETALGSPEKQLQVCEAGNRDAARKSIVAARAIPRGAVIDESMLALKRPGTGLSPAYLGEIVGRKAKAAIKKDTLVTRDMVA